MYAYYETRIMKKTTEIRHNFVTIFFVIILFHNSLNSAAAAAARMNITGTTKQIADTRVQK